jgi:hypothetical protein
MIVFSGTEACLSTRVERSTEDRRDIVRGRGGSLVIQCVRRRHCGGVTLQNPLMHRFVGSQQSAAVVQTSCGAEQSPVGGAFKHTSAPESSGWQ